MPLFLTGFIQVFFVAVNTYLISIRHFTGVAACSFIISFIWSYNVKKVAFGTMKERIIYSIGATIGGISALLLTLIF